MWSSGSIKCMFSALIISKAADMLSFYWTGDNEQVNTNVCIKPGEDPGSWRTGTDLMDGNQTKAKDVVQNT